jgi:hypothetical protein
MNDNGDRITTTEAKAHTGADGPDAAGSVTPSSSRVLISRFRSA